MTTAADRFTPVRSLGPHLQLVQDRDGAPLILKHLGENRTADALARHRFRLEAWRLAQLTSPRFARLYVDATDLAEAPYYTMGYAEGPPATLVQPFEVASCVRELLEALAILHRRGWVHAALAPANLRRTEGGLVVVGYGNLTPIGHPAPGTATTPYTAPEQRAGHPLDGRADLYAVGALIHFWLTGEPPGAADMLDMVADPLARIGRVLLAEDPAKRPGDAEAVLALLHQGLVAPGRDPNPLTGAAPGTDLRAPHHVPARLPRRAAVAAFEPHFAALRDGAGACLALVAPAGAGVSTALAIAGEQATAAGWPVATMRGRGRHARPMGCWHLLAERLGEVANHRQPGLAERFRPRLLELAFEGSAETPTGPTPSATPLLEIARQRALGTLAELLAAVAPPGLVILVDDWDAADQASGEALAWLVARMADQPILWLVATPVPLPFATTIAWPAFTSTETANLADTLVPAPLTPEVLHALHDASGGLPWAVVTALDLWRETGELRCLPGRCEVPAILTWPRGVASVAWQRGSALDGSAWTVGGVAALMLPRVPPRALEVLIADREILAEGLDHLLRAGILALDGDRYRFTHPAYAAMYQRVLDAERAATLYGQLFDAAIANDLGLDALEIAWLAVRGERPKEVAARALAVARTALSLGGRETARLLLEEGLVTLGSDHPSLSGYLAALGELCRLDGDPVAAATHLREARARWAAGAPADRPGVALALAQVLTGLGQHREALTHWREAAGHAQMAGDIDLLACALAGLTTTQLALGDTADAIASGETAVGVAADASPLPKALAMAALGGVLAVGERERQPEGVALLQRASALFEAEGDRARLTGTLLALADAAIARGELPFARDSARRAEARAREDGDAAALALSTMLLARAAYALGDFGVAATEAARATAAAQTANDAATGCEAYALSGLLRVRAGDPDGHNQLAESSRPGLPPATRARIALARAEAWIVDGRHAEAATALVAAAEPVREARRPDLVGLRSYWQGIWAARTGDREAARQELRAALAQPSPVLVASAALALGRLAVEVGARVEAAGWFEQARRAAMAQGLEVLAADAERAEKALAGQQPHDDDTPGAAIGRLDAVLAEARALIPRVAAAQAEQADLARQLVSARALNALWSQLFAATSPLEIARALADAVFATTPARRVFVLGSDLAPWIARTREAGDIPYAATLVHEPFCRRAVAGQVTAGPHPAAMPGPDHAAALPLTDVAIVYVASEKPLDAAALAPFAEAAGRALLKMLG